LGDLLSKQAEDLHSECQSLFPEQPIRDIFLAEYLTSEGSRQYGCLHYFTSTRVFEIESFESKPVIWCAALEPVTLKLAKQDFDLQCATDSSRLNARVGWTRNDFVLDMKASGKNCEDLMKVLRTYFLPQVVALEGLTSTVGDRAGK